MGNPCPSPSARTLFYSARERRKKETPGWINIKVRGDDALYPVCGRELSKGFLACLCMFRVPKLFLSKEFI